MAKSTKTTTPARRGRPIGSKNKSKTSTDVSEATPTAEIPIQAMKTKRKRGGKKKIEEDDEDNDAGGCRVVWDEKLTDALLQELTDNPEIKQGLYPGPGTMGIDCDGNPITKSNSKPKAEYQLMLAQALFGNANYGYQTRFEADAKEVSGQKWWANKVKTKLDMQQQVKVAQKLMGNTGEGLTSEDQINMSLNNSLTTAWSKVKKTCPWYFTMISIIGERPNLTPVGLGNSATTIDTSSLFANEAGSGDIDSVGEDENEGNKSDDSHRDDGIPLDFDSDDDSNDGDNNLLSTVKRVKRSASSPPSLKLKHGPKEAKSDKAAKPVPIRKANPMDRFAEISKAEQATAQQKLKLRQSRLSMEEKLEMEKIRVMGKTKVSREQVRADYELRKLELQQGHEYRMMLLKSGHGGMGTNSGDRFNAGSGGMATSSSNGELDRFNAGSSGSHSDEFSFSSPSFGDEFDFGAFGGGMNGNVL